MEPIPETEIKVHHKPEAVCRPEPPLSVDEFTRLGLHVSFFEIRVNKLHCCKTGEIKNKLKS